MLDRASFTCGRSGTVSISCDARHYFTFDRILSPLHKSYRVIVFPIAALRSWPHTTPAIVKLRVELQLNQHKLDTAGAHPHERHILNIRRAHYAHLSRKPGDIMGEAANVFGFRNWYHGTQSRRGGSQAGTRGT